MKSLVVKIKGQVTTDLVTDEDFIEANEVVKTLKAAEKAIDDARKKEIIEGALESIEGFLLPIISGSEYLWRDMFPDFLPSLRAAIKGKKKLETAQKAVEETVKKLQEEITITVKTAFDNNQQISAAGRNYLFPDKKALMLKPAGELTAIIESRLAKDDLELKEIEECMARQYHAMT